jgi:hypothetical protein
MLHPCCGGEQVFIFALQKYVKVTIRENPDDVEGTKDNHFILLGIIFLEHSNN